MSLPYSPLVVPGGTGGGGGTIGGSIAATQVAFGSGVNTIAGSNNFIWTNASSTLTINGAFSASATINLATALIGEPFNLGITLNSSADNAGSASPIIGSFTISDNHNYTADQWSQLSTFTLSPASTVGTVSQFLGITSTTLVRNHGHVGNLALFSTLGNVFTGGTIDTLIGFWGRAVGVHTGTLTTAYTAKFDAPGAGSTQWNVGIDGGNSYVNGKLKVGNNSTPSVELDVQGQISVVKTLSVNGDAMISALANANDGTSSFVGMTLECDDTVARTAGDFSGYQFIYESDPGSTSGSTIEGFDALLLGTVGQTSTAFHANAGWTNGIMIDGANLVFSGAQNALNGVTMGAFSIEGGAHTNLPASTELTSVLFKFNQNIQFATGNFHINRTTRFRPPTISFVGASILDVATNVSIQGGPIAGTNATLTFSSGQYIETWASNAASAFAQIVELPGIANGVGATSGIAGVVVLSGLDGQVEVGNQTAVTDTVAGVFIAALGLHSTTNTRTFTAAAALIIEGAPINNGNVIFTNPALALWVQSGPSLFDGDVSVPDEAYGSGWNGSLEVPTKNAIYDKIETISTILSGTATLSAGTVTISAAITANSRILVTVKDANPGAGGLTIGFEAPVASRNVGAGTFVVRANVAAGTINVLDTSTFDWVVVG